MKIFISYTTRDKIITEDLLREFDNMLSNFGDVFIDLIHNDSYDKQKRVFEELDSCDRFIIIESENTYKSNWVNLEIQRAQKLKKEMTKLSLSNLLLLLNKQLNLNKIIKNQTNRGISPLLKPAIKPGLSIPRHS